MVLTAVNTTRARRDEPVHERGRVASTASIVGGGGGGGGGGRLQYTLLGWQTSVLWLDGIYLVCLVWLFGRF